MDDLIEIPEIDLSKTKIGFIGAGNIASALAGGIVKTGMISPNNMIASAPSGNTFEYWKKLGCKTTNSNKEVAEASEIIFMCVKPQHLEDALKDMSPGVNHSKLIVSTLSGIPLSILNSRLKTLVTKSVRIIRAMPNTAVMVGCGCTVVSPHSSASRADVETIKALFSAVGRCEIVSEKFISPLIGVSGSSPAFIYIIIEAMADAGVSYGLPRQLALIMASQAVMGSAKMVLESGQHPGQLKDAVCSPGGSTIAGILALEKAGLRSAIISAVDAAASKSEEMTRALAASAAPRPSI